MLETVVGTNGILVPPDGYLAGVRELCDEHGIVMIADEVMAGFGRCGEWFAVDHWDVTPDLITFAKGVNSGYVPLGGVIISEEIAATFGDACLPGGLTYSGHPLALRVGRGDHQDLRGRGHHRARPPRSAPTSIGPAFASMASATRRSARCAGSACSGRSSWSATDDPRAARALQRLGRRPPRRWARSPRALQGRAACGRSRTSTACTSSRRSRSATTRCATGLAIIDEALAVADKHAVTTA